MELSGPKKLNKTPLGETGCLSNPFYSLAAQVSNFLIHPLSRTQLVTRHLVASTSLYNPCVRAIGLQVLPTQPLPREAEDLPKGGKYFNYVPLLTANLLLSKWYDLVGSIYV